MFPSRLANGKKRNSSNSHLESAIGGREENRKNNKKSSTRMNYFSFFSVSGKQKLFFIFPRHCRFIAPAWKSAAKKVVAIRNENKL